MNVKKQLNKIENYIEELKTEGGKLQQELHNYQLTAYKFVHNNITSSQAREEFNALLGDLTFIGGDFVAKYDGAAWDSLTPIPEIWNGISHEDSYAKLIEENKRLREALRWHPVSELPKTEIERLWSANVLLKNNYAEESILAYYSIKSKRWCDYHKAEYVKVNDKSRWCYIPEYKEE